MEKVKMPRVRFIYDRKKTANKTNKKGLIEVEVYFNAKRTYFSTGMSVFKDQWKKDAIVGLQSQIEDNEFIGSIKTILQEAVNKQFKENQSVNFDELRKIYAKSRQSEKPSTPTFLDFMKERMQARPMAYGTWKQHRSVLNVLTDWGKIRTFADLTPGNIKLWDELSVKNSKTGKPIETYHKVLRIYVKEAITFADTLNLPKDFRNPYDGFTVKRDRTVKHAFLTIEELDRWRKITLPTADIEKARDMFVFCAFTSVAFADMTNGFLSSTSPGGYHKVQQLTPLVTCQMQLKAKEPSHGALASLRNALEYLVDMYPLVPAYSKGSAVHETYASTFSEQHLLDE